MFFVYRETQNAIFDVQDENARNVLNTVLLNVENEYKSLVFHRKVMIERRNAELNNIITIAFNSLEDFYESFQKGEMSEIQAKDNATRVIENLRYDNDVGYIWINDTGTPLPRMIMHPTIPELNGTILDDEKFNCALGIKKNLFQAFVEICTRKGDGYVDYLWPKPQKGGLSPEKPKLSYGRLFKPWGWILGTGVYIDDIEEEIKKRHDAILKELKQTFKKIRVANSGYMYLFNHKQEMIIHPSLEGEDFSNLVNPVTNNPILKDLIAAEKTEQQQIDYLWEKPPDFKRQFRFWKRSYVVYFEPLKWYIASSVYFDEKKISAQRLQTKLFLISAVFIGLGLLISLLLSKSLTTPLDKLMYAAKNIEKDGFSSNIFPVTGTIETKALGTIFAHLIQSLQQGLDEKEVLLKEIHHRVKNNMAVVISLLGLQARDAKEKRIKIILEDSQNRIKSMALIHESLYKSTNISEISLKEYAQSLIKTISYVMQTPKGKIETRINADNIILTADQAVPCGLILNELLTNSFKYAFSPTRANRIDITAQYTENPYGIKLVVHDNGPGLPEQTEVKEIKSLGLRIISLLVENQLEGHWNIRNDNGACFTIHWPIDKQ